MLAEEEKLNFKAVAIKVPSGPKELCGWNGPCELSGNQPGGGGWAWGKFVLMR